MWGLAVAVGLMAWWGKRYSEKEMLTHETAPFTGYWRPHLPAGVLLPLVVLALVVLAYPVVARLRWGLLLVGSVAGAALWTVALALVDGRGELIRPLHGDSYLHDVPRVHGLGTFLSTFTRHIDALAPNSWHTHVAGHPPGALLTFVGLDRLGLGGPGPAAALDIVGGAVAVPATLLVCRLLAGEVTARRAAPFLVLAPAALWVATSADGFFLGVASWAVALAALAGRRRSWLLAISAGTLFGLVMMLSYGLVLIGLIAITALLAAGRDLRVAAWFCAASLAVLLAAAAGGFWWIDGLRAASHRVDQGVGGLRPVGYWLVADLVLLAFAVGPATLAALGRPARVRPMLPVVWATLAAVLVADVSGQSKGEVERIWLAFTPLLLITCAGLRNPRRWLMLQGVLSIGFQLLVRSTW